MTYHCEARWVEPGDTIRIGDMLGHHLDPNLIIGRVCGFIKGEHPEVLYRRYRTQEEKWPSGHVHSRPFCVTYPHMCFPGTNCKRFIIEPKGIDNHGD